MTREGQRHQLCRRETECRDIAKAVQEPPADMAIDTLGEQGKVRRFQGLQIATKGARMFGEIRWKGCEEFVEREAALRRFQPLQRMPLSRDLVIARHNEFPIRSCDSSMSPTITGRWKSLVSLADYRLPATGRYSLFEGEPRHRLRGRRGLCQRSVLSKKSRRGANRLRQVRQGSERTLPKGAGTQETWRGRKAGTD